MKEILTKNLIIYFIFIVFAINAYSQNWELQKESSNIKAYTAKRDNSSIKSYKIVANVDASIDCVHSILSDYSNYPKMIKNLTEMKIIKDEDNELIAFTVYDLPWPIQNRDLVSQVKIIREENKIKFKTKSLKNSEIEKKNKVIRITDFNEEFVIEKVKNNQSKITIIGNIDIGGSIPVWVQNIFVIDGPMDIINYVDEKCKKE